MRTDKHIPYPNLRQQWSTVWHVCRAGKPLAGDDHAAVAGYGARGSSCTGSTGIRHDHAQRRQRPGGTAGEWRRRRAQGCGRHGVQVPHQRRQHRPDDPAVAGGWLLATVAGLSGELPLDFGRRDGKQQPGLPVRRPERLRRGHDPAGRPLPDLGAGRRLPDRRCALHRPRRQPGQGRAPAIPAPGFDLACHDF